MKMAARRTTPPVLPSRDAIPGHTYQEALTNIREAVELYVEDLREAGDPIPVDPDLGALELPTPAVAVNV